MLLLHGAPSNLGLLKQDLSAGLVAGYLLKDCSNVKGDFAALVFFLPVLYHSVVDPIAAFERICEKPASASLGLLTTKPEGKTMKLSPLLRKFLFALALLPLRAAPAFAAEPRAPDHSLFTHVLRDHVKDGAVNYKAIKTDARFAQYLALLQNTAPDSIPARHRLAFWLNAYNAFTIQFVLEHYPIKSLMSPLKYVLGGGAFRSEFIRINGKKYSLDDLEHNIVRPMGDPRVHFALVCGAKSCPPLRSEAYDGERLGEQMDEQARLFLSRPDKNRFDFEKNEIHISKIFDWFKDDFRKDGKTELDFIGRYLPPEQAEKLRANAKTLKVKYTEYDWDLNE